MLLSIFNQIKAWFLPVVTIDRRYTVQENYGCKMIQEVNLVIS